MTDDLLAMLRSGARRRWAAVLEVGVVLIFAAACGSDSDVVIIAITATPQTASSTATTAAQTPLTPTTATSTATPEPSAELPPRPDNLFGGANLLVAYLAGGADTAACLPALAVAWGLDRGTQLDCVETDLDGDGAAEFVLRVTEDRGATTPGDIWFYASVEQGRRLLGSARSFGGSVLSGVLIVATEDLTGDGLAEVVISSESCGAASCTTNFLIMSAHRGTLENLAPDDVALEGSETPEVTDVTGDGLLDLVLRGGVVSSAGAGPPRALVRSVYWSGLRFFVVDEAQAPRYLIHAIADADAAYAGADYTTAATQYLAIATSSTLSDWKLDTGAGLGRNELAAYARFRAGLASQRLGAIEQSLTLFEGAYDDHPTALMGVASAVYLDQLQKGVTAAAACAVTEQYLSTRAAEFARIWDYGYANPEHTITGICR